MWSAGLVLVCALDLLGRSARSFPPINLLDVRPGDVSAHADAFVRQGEDVIHLLTSAPAFQRVQRSPHKCGNHNDLRKLASILVHEEWHVRNGPDERRAYEAQLMALITLDAGPGHPVYAGVVRAMADARARQRRQRKPPSVARGRGAGSGAGPDGLTLDPNTSLLRSHVDP